MSSLQQSKLVTFYLQNISQAYVQFNIYLNRDIFIQLPYELNLQLKTILWVIKPLYKVLEAKNYWFKTYHQHHINRLKMEQLTYDPYLLYTQLNNFSIVGLQTNNTLFLANQTFADIEEIKL